MLTNKDAHGYLEDMQRILTQNRFIFSREMMEANGLAILAIEKQILRAPTILKKYPYNVYACPVCGKPLNKNECNYCPDCGQAIDWTDCV